MNIKNKIACISGASSGLGAAKTRHLSKKGVQAEGMFPVCQAALMVDDCSIYLIYFRPSKYLGQICPN